MCFYFLLWITNTTNTKYNTLFKNSHKQQQEQTNCQSNKATFLPHIDHSTVFARWCQRGGTRWCLVIHSSLVQNQSATHPRGIFIGSSVSAGMCVQHRPELQHIISSIFTSWLLHSETAWYCFTSPPPPPAWCTHKLTHSETSRCCRLASNIPSTYRRIMCLCQWHGLAVLQHSFGLWMPNWTAKFASLIGMVPPMSVHLADSLWKCSQKWHAVYGCVTIFHQI